ncbi:MAG: hypothetical protein WBY94_05070, partial [Polyangiaceae bacterium]
MQLRVAVRRGDHRRFGSFFGLLFGLQRRRRNQLGLLRNDTRRVGRSLRQQRLHLGYQFRGRNERELRIQFVRIVAGRIGNFPQQQRILFRFRCGRCSELGVRLRLIRLDGQRLGRLVRGRDLRRFGNDVRRFWRHGGHRVALE